MPQSPSCNPLVLDAIQPVVLVGGVSARFGRNKLLEPLESGGMLVDRSIGALRSVFGGRVALVGRCDPQVAARGDLIAPDHWPGTGPAGGVASALSHFGRDVFVLAGDLPNISAAAILTVLECAGRNPQAAAALACVQCPEPCVGFYRLTALDSLTRSLKAGDSCSITKRLEGLTIALAPVDPVALLNANTPEQLDAARQTVAGGEEP